MRNFAVSEDIDELKQLIENNGEDILVEKYQQKYLCLYGEQPFLIEEVEKLEVDAENDHRYFFYAPLATLELIDKSNSSLPVVKKKARFHLPVHLLKEFERESYYDYIFDIDYSCELVSDFDALADFYRAFKIYEVETEDGILSVTNTDTWGEGTDYSGGGESNLVPNQVKLDKKTVWRGGKLKWRTVQKNTLEKEFCANCK